MIYANVYSWNGPSTQYFRRVRYHQWIIHNLYHVEYWNYTSALFRDLIYIAAEALNNALKIYFVIVGFLYVCVRACVCVKDT